MSPAQTSLYWREWAAVRRMDPDANRHALHIQALGRDVSSKAFTNAQFDQVLGVFRAISRPADLNAQLRQQQQPRTRLLHIIEQLAPGPYLAKIMSDRWGHTDLDRLSIPELEQLRFTLTSRSRKNNLSAQTAECPF